MVCFRKPREREDVEAIRSTLTTIHEIIERHIGSSYSVEEPLLLAVGMQQTVSPSLEMGPDEWDDLCRECGGWEWIDGELGSEDDDKAGEKGQRQRNEFGGKPKSSSLALAYDYQTLIPFPPGRKGGYLTAERSS